MPVEQALEMMRSRLGTSIDADCLAALERSLGTLAQFSAFATL